MAVVVSYNGRMKTLQTIEKLVEQVDHVHVVDNASGAESISILEALICQPNISATWLTKNRGIGHALNLGVNVARQKGYRWLLTMDQDSTICPSAIEAFMQVVSDSPSLACLAANYTGDDFHSPGDSHEVDYAITSGNLVRMDVFDRVGLYDEDLFIDGVDFDFSLRVRMAGFNIVMVRDARMHHQLGDKVSSLPVIGRFHTYHSPVRRYYMYRNFLYLMNQYAAAFPVFFLKLGMLHLLYLVTTLLLGGQRFKSMNFIAKGIVDYFHDKKGPLQIL